MVSVNRLKEYSFFEGFSDEQLEKLAAIATEESYKAGYQIYKEGDTAENFHLLEEGKIVRAKKILIVSQGPPEEVAVDFVKKGQAMEWTTLVEPYIYSMGARCIDDSKLIAFNAAKLSELIYKNHISLLKIVQAVWKSKISRPDDERVCAFSFSPGCM